MENQISIYQFCINNIRNKIQSAENRIKIESNDITALTPYSFAFELSIAFMKREEDVLLDIIKGF